VESIIIEWNGSEIPQGMRDLPPGRYVVEALDEPITLTPEQEGGLMRAMDDLDAGRGRPLAEALSHARELLDRR